MKKLIYIALAMIGLIGHSKPMNPSLDVKPREYSFTEKVDALVSRGITLPEDIFHRMDVTKVLDLLAETRALVDGSANDVIKSILEARDQNTGWTVLHFAVDERNVDAVRRLLSYGADMFASAKYEATPYDMALIQKTENNYKDIFNILEQRHSIILFNPSTERDLLTAWWPSALYNGGPVRIPMIYTLKGCMMTLDA